MEQVRLIINGDDFGFSEAVNDGIIRAFREGVLTSCSLMVSGAAFEHAVHLASENEGLAVGLHVVTVQGKSVLPRRKIPSIVDGDQSFSNDPVAAGIKYYVSMKARREIEMELAAQFEKFASTGLELSHIDSHLHMHVHPVVFDCLLRLGVEYGARRMRVPEDDLRMSLLFERGQWLKQTAERTVFRVLCRSMRKKLSAKGFVFADRVHGHFMSGRMSEEYLIYVLDHLGVGANEVYFHPAAYGEGVSLDPHERQRLREFNILVSEKIQERLHRPLISLTTYKGLQTN
jgi:chitin disaccharide deacetylase